MNNYVVYLMEVKNLFEVGLKVGRTTNLSQREYSLAHGGASPCRVKTIAVLHGVTEEEVHNHLKFCSRVVINDRGEYYKWDKRLFDYFGADYYPEPPALGTMEGMWNVTYAPYTSRPSMAQVAQAAMMGGGSSPDIVEDKTGLVNCYVDNLGLISATYKNNVDGGYNMLVNRAGCNIINRGSIGWDRVIGIYDLSRQWVSQHGTSSQRKLIEKQQKEFKSLFSRFRRNSVVENTLGPRYGKHVKVYVDTKTQKAYLTRQGRLVDVFSGKEGGGKWELERVAAA